MNYCRISLKPVKRDSKYPHYLDSEFRKLFQSLRVNPVLSFTRKEFFRQSPSKSKGMSISGVQQKLSLKINSDNELKMTPTEGEYILKPSPETFFACFGKRALCHVNKSNPWN
jgi:serine/threonine-protein kinase HipA